MRVRSILAAAGVACAVAAAAATYASAQEPPAPQAQPQPPAPQQATPPAPTPQPAQAPDPKAILESACTSCHGLDFVTEHHKDHAGWEFTVSTMISRGADLNPDEAKLVVDYLAKTYPADAPKAEDKPG